MVLSNTHLRVFPGRCPNRGEIYAAPSVQAIVASNGCEDAHNILTCRNFQRQKQDCGGRRPVVLWCHRWPGEGQVWTAGTDWPRMR